MMGTITANDRLFSIDDDVLETFESLADTSSGPVGPDAMHKMIDACGDDLYRRMLLVQWLFIWRDMSPKETTDATRGCPPEAVKRVAMVAGKNRQRKLPYMRAPRTN